MKYNVSSLLIFIALLWSCSQSKLDDQTYSKFQARGNEISTLAQTTLLANVGQAIQQGGPEYAVVFCNLKASGIIDSLNEVNSCTIARDSEKNRNPENALKSAADKDLWEAFQNSTQSDTVVLSDNKIVYYKRITTAMPACLKCHGDTEVDINRVTLEKIQSLYPEDKATGYHLNDFRGLWKIEFEKR
jgi:Protein of unknown function (DUF3365)